MNKYIATFLLLFVIMDTNGQDSILGKKTSTYADSIIKFKVAGSINEDFPNFSVNLNNKSITNKTLVGKKVFINFWFEACAPCVAEFKPLNEMYNKLKGKKGVKFLTFTFES